MCQCGRHALFGSFAANNVVPAAGPLSCGVCHDAEWLVNKWRVFPSVELHATADRERAPWVATDPV